MSDPKQKPAQTVVVDTSVIINGQLMRQIESGSIQNCDIIVPQAVFDELQSQASQKRDQGYVGLEEIKRIKDISTNFGLTITTKGNHPTTDDIKMADHGRIDTIIKDIAKQNNAILYTSDKAQHLVALAEGINSVLVKPDSKPISLEFLRFFDSTTMSIHLKENLLPVGKKGKPGSFTLERLSNDVLSKEYLEFLVTQILDSAKTSDSSTIEISKTGASVVQLKDYRIAITRPPFSEALEITIVHPTVKMTLDEYNLSEELMKRFVERAEGILISGAPGSGKSTLASGLANFYHSTGKIVKTFESPRDLQVDPAITQYTKLDGSFDNAADILLLVRPDYTIFDEVRRREDFRTFADLRLTGVGMVGVVHANSPIDSIQRFIGKIELGIIPSVLDTVIFVDAGKIDKVYSLELKVRVPTGMTESDLARPVIEIRNFEDKTLEHEIYTFGEENVIVPVTKRDQKIGIERLAEDKIRDIFARYDPRAEVEIISDNRVRVLVDRNAIPSIIGRGGTNINEIERKLNIHIDVEEKNSKSSSTASSDLPFSFSESKNSLLLNVGREYSSMHADIFVRGDHVASVRIGQKGQIKIPKRSEIARNLANSAMSQKDIHVFLKDF